MKNFINILILNMLVFVTSMQAEITYRQASPNDIEGILKLYINMPLESKKNLFIFPSLEIQKKVILKNIDKKRLVVAVDGNTIIGFVKNFIINDQEELKECLVEELNIVNTDGYSLEKCLEYKTYNVTNNINLNINSVQNFFGQFPNPVSQDINKENLDILSSCIKNKNHSIFIYTGAYYTAPEYRNKHINTNLCLYQLETIFKTIKNRIQKEKITYIALIYGQVLVNTNHIGMVREFAYYLQPMFLTEKFILHHYLFKAVKPEFNNNGKIIFLDKNEGRGSIVIFKVLKKSFN